MIGRILCALGRHDWVTDRYLDVCVRRACHGRYRGTRWHQ